MAKMMRFLLFAFVITVCSASLWGGKKEGTMQKAGRVVDEAAENIGDRHTFERVGKTADNAAEYIGEKATEAYHKAGEYAAYLKEKARFFSLDNILFC